MVIFGVIANFLGAFFIFFLFFIYLRNYRLEFLLVSFLLTFFLGDNITGIFSFANNLRFLMLGFSLIYLIKFKLLFNNFGFNIVLFCVVAVFSTFLFSPLGLPAISRSISFLFVGLVVFKLVNVLYNYNPVSTSYLIICTFFIYVLINLMLLPVFYANFYLMGRFKGLMNNPNGLGLLLMFLYAFIDFYKKDGGLDVSGKVFKIYKLILFFLVFYSGSRTGLIAIVIYEFSYFVFYKKGISVLVFILGLPIFYVLLTVDLVGLIESFGLGDRLRLNTLETASGRTEVWSVAWDEIKNQPFFGKGMMYDDFFINNYRVINIGNNAARHWYGVWSSYLSLLLNVGVVGLVMYFIFLLKCFMSSQNKRLAFSFLMMVLASGVTESWMAASMNALTPLLFLYFAIQIYKPKDLPVV